MATSENFLFLSLVKMTLKHLFAEHKRKKVVRSLTSEKRGLVSLIKDLYFTIVISYSGTAGLAESVWESVGEWLGWEEGGDLNSWIGRIQGGWERQLEVGSFVV